MAQSPLSSPQQEYVTWYNKGVNMLSNKSYTDALAAFDNAISVDLTRF